MTRTSKPAKPIPDGYRTVTPYLIVPGVVRLIDFLKQAFDAKEIMRMPLADGTIMHAAVRIGDSVLMMPLVDRHAQGGRVTRGTGEACRSRTAGLMRHRRRRQAR